MTIEVALVISGISVAFGIYQGICNLRRNNRNDDKNDATQLTTVIVKLENIGDGIKKLNQAPYEVKGFRLFDKVKYNGQECFIFGRRSSGYFDLRKLDGTVIHRSASYKSLKLIQQRKSLLIERREAG